MSTDPETSVIVTDGKPAHKDAVSTQKHRREQIAIRHMEKFINMAADMEMEELDVANEKKTEARMQDLSKLHARIEKLRNWLVKRGVDKYKQIERLSKEPMRFKGSGFKTLDDRLTVFINKSNNDDPNRGFSAAEGKNYTELFCIPNIATVKQMVVQLVEEKAVPAGADIEGLSERVANAVCHQIIRRRIQDRYDWTKDMEAVCKDVYGLEAPVEAENEDLKKELEENQKLAKKRIKEVMKEFADVQGFDGVNLDDIPLENLGDNGEGEEGDNVDDPLLDDTDDRMDLVDVEVEDGEEDANDGLVDLDKIQEHSENGQQASGDSGGDSDSGEEEQNDIDEQNGQQESNGTRNGAACCSDDNDMQPAKKRPREEGSHFDDDDDDVIVLD